MTLRVTGQPPDIHLYSTGEWLSQATGATEHQNKAILTDVDPEIGGIDLPPLAVGVRHASGQRWNVGVSPESLGGGNPEGRLEYRTEEESGRIEHTSHGRRRPLGGLWNPSLCGARFKRGELSTGVFIPY